MSTERGLLSFQITHHRMTELIAARCGQLERELAASLAFEAKAQAADHVEIDALGRGYVNPTPTGEWMRASSTVRQQMGSLAIVQTLVDEQPEDLSSGARTFTLSLVDLARLDLITVIDRTIL